MLPHSTRPGRAGNHTDGSPLADQWRVRVQPLDPVTTPPAEKEQEIAVRTHFISIPDDGHQPIDTPPHVSVACDQVKFCHIGHNILPNKAGARQPGYF